MEAGSGFRACGWRRCLLGLRDDVLNRTSAYRAPLVWGCRRGLVAVPVGGGRAWPGFETTRRAKLAARTASGRAAARRHARQPGSTVRRDGARNASGAASNTVGGSPPAGTPSSPAHQAARPPQQGATVPGAPVEPHTTAGNQPEYPASSVARWTPPRPASWAA